MEKFNIGIIGAGHIAEKMAFTLNRMEDAAAYAVASRSLEKAENFASVHGVEKAYGSYEELLDDPQVDMVYVATPHSLHLHHVKMCLEKGRPVLCEKAFMLNRAEAEEAIRLSEERNVFLAEAIWTRYMPFRKTVREVIDSGRIGRPMMLTAHLGYPVAHKERIIDPSLGGGALLDLGVYVINFALMMFGDGISSISSTCVKADTGVDLQESITFTWPDGKMAVMQATALCASERQAIICGDKGYIVLDNINNPLKAEIWSAGHVLEETLHAPEQITGFEYQVRACISAIREGRIETDFMPHSETLRVMELMDTVRTRWEEAFSRTDI
ncbi:MAG: Gfo/Idh/MocA family oxidoreductase [Bacteroidetes bacterium]|uniref:Gfo/Idh/MocA family oxidoreductase n=1 Tax=Candidatus Cryptobacteroides merdavium TaxID=2840769 RepID=A0A9D9EBV4_9BACT|nr:Gfo/Idh/MocA family oxidoreductase [Candidatus Cryptobacteroides merdavium]